MEIKAIFIHSEGRSIAHVSKRLSFFPCAHLDQHGKRRGCLDSEMFWVTEYQLIRWLWGRWICDLQYLIEKPEICFCRRSMSLFSTRWWNISTKQDCLIESTSFDLLAPYHERLSPNVWKSWKLIWTAFFITSLRQHLSIRDVQWWKHKTFENKHRAGQTFRVLFCSKRSFAV